MSCTAAKYLQCFKNAQYCRHSGGLSTQTTKVTVYATFLDARIKQLPKVTVSFVIFVRPSLRLSIYLFL
jgi:hypothetical protein